jgi:hypothetical protein
MSCPFFIHESLLFQLLAKEGRTDKNVFAISCHIASSSWRDFSSERNRGIKKDRLMQEISVISASTSI